MTPDEYLSSVIKKNKAKPINYYNPKLTNIKNIIRKWAGENLNDMYLSGSSAKDTAIQGVSDCDIFISLENNDTLKNFFYSLRDYVEAEGYKVRTQNVSLGIKYEGLNVDLVPGRLITGYQNYHNLYLSKKNSWLQTNVKLHIDEICNSIRKDEIILTKIWRSNHNIDFPSIYLELIVLEALYNKHSGQLAINFKRVLNFLADDFVNTKIVDPANTNNIISDMLSLKEKESIRDQAKKSLKEQYWNNIVW